MSTDKNVLEKKRIEIQKDIIGNANIVMRHFRIAMHLFLGMIFSCQPDRHNVADSFDADRLSDVWDDRKFLPGALEIQSEIVRGGKGAAKITLRPGDQIPQEKGTILERAELTESQKLWSLEDVLYAYEFSIFLPLDFPFDSTRLVIAQWKQECPVESCTPDNPLIAIRYVADRLYITHLGPDLKILYETSGNVRNQWLDFKFNISFSRTKEGRIEAWLNKKKIVDYVGVNAYPPSGGYPDQNQFYFKTGLYRDKADQPMTLYFDEYRKNLISKASDSL